MSRQLLIDYLPFRVDPQLVMESYANGKPLIVTGTLQRADAKNQNGRVYPEKILQRESQNYAKTFIAERRALGELDHPDSSVVNLQNASHNVLEMWWDGKDLKGKVEILDTPAGKILKELFRANIQLGISSRGLGSVKQISESSVEVQDDFELIAFDFVSNPSTHGAFLTPTEMSSVGGMNEGLLKESVDKNLFYANKYHAVENAIREIICTATGECTI